MRKEAKGTSNLKAKLSTIKAENKALRNREVKLDK
jgi:hypothetical protein